MTDEDYRKETLTLFRSIQANLSCLTWIIVGAVLFTVAVGGCTVMVPMVLMGN